MHPFPCHARSHTQHSCAHVPWIPPFLLQLPSRVAHNWVSTVLSSLLSVLTAWYIPQQGWASSSGLALPNGLQLFIDRKGVGWTGPQ
jgi:hypothetical protein